MYNSSAGRKSQIQPEEKIRKHDAETGQNTPFAFFKRINQDFLQKIFKKETKPQLKFHEIVQYCETIIS